MERQMPFYNMMSSNRKDPHRVSNVGRGLMIVFKALVSIALISYLLTGVSVPKAWQSATQLPVSTILAALLLLLGYAATSASRWFLVLHSLGSTMPKHEALRITYVSMFFNQFLPATVGADAIRIWEASRGGLRIAVAINSVLIERIVHLLGLSMTAAAMASAWSDGRIPVAMSGSLWVVSGVAVIAVICLCALDRVPLWQGSMLWRVSVKSLSGDLQGSLRSPAFVAAQLGIVALGLAVLSGAVFVLAIGLGIRIGFGDCVALMPTVLLVSALPVSIAGWGIREYAMSTVLAYAGVTAANALLLSLLLGVFVMIASLPGAVFWFVARTQLRN
jgi:uncharacterized membrane protein YbhN (UPF0104 family)